MKKPLIGICCCLAALYSCNTQPEKKAKTVKTRQQPVRQQPRAITYQFTKASQWLDSNKTDSSKLAVVVTLNRTDLANFAKMDTVIVPTDISGDIAYYLPFPLSVKSLQPVDKIIFFSYPAQVFATYENGILIYTGATNMGRKKDPTPTGLFFSNWKAESTISTVNDEWELLWNFNIANKEGVGWHQYAMPGYPASHSCLRLQEKDARYLYNWADQWILDDHENVLAKGTPVIVFGSYDFDAAKPWWKLVSDPHALDISEAEITQQASSFLNTILAEQEKREATPAKPQR